MSEAAARASWKPALGCALLCTAFLAFFTNFPSVADERLALPIARAAADSTLYPPGDLVVSSGLQGPFHLYRAAGVLYAQGWNVDAIWLAALLALLVATFAATWGVAFGISRSAWIASLAVSILAAASPYRGTLHWFLFPPGNLVTSTVATPLVLGALALALGGRWGPALILSALTFNVHPSMGLVSAAAIALAMVANDGMTWPRRLAWWAGAVACAAPNVLFVLRSAGANFAAAPAAGGHTFADLFGLYAHHAWIGDHWRENYGWFVMQVAGLILLRRFLTAESRRATFALLAAFGAIGALWFANLYTANYPALTLTFAIRGVAFVKVIAVAGLAVVVTGWVRGVGGRDRFVRGALAGVLLAGALHKNLDIGEGFAAIAWAGVVFMELKERGALRFAVALPLFAFGLLEVLGQGWGVLGVAPFSPERVDQVRLATIAAGSLFMIATAATLRRPVDAAAARAFDPVGVGAALATCVAIFVVTIGLRGSVSRLQPSSPSAIWQAARLAQPDPEIADLARWAGRGTAGGALFAIPPTDSRFNAFRLAAGRGVFASTYEVDQLSYNQAVYGSAHARLLQQGMVVQGRHAFDGAAWDSLSAERVTALANAGVDFAVFSATVRRARPLSFPVVYEDARWVVHDIRPVR